MFSLIPGSTDGWALEQITQGRCSGSATARLGRERLKKLLWRTVSLQRLMLLRALSGCSTFYLQRNSPQQGLLFPFWCFQRNSKQGPRQRCRPGLGSLRGCSTGPGRSHGLSMWFQREQLHPHPRPHAQDRNWVCWSRERRGKRSGMQGDPLPPTAPGAVTWNIIFWSKMITARANCAIHIFLCNIKEPYN